MAKIAANIIKKTFPLPFLNSLISFSSMLASFISLSCFNFSFSTSTYAWLRTFSALTASLSKINSLDLQYGHISSVCSLFTCTVAPQALHFIKINFGSKLFSLIFSPYIFYTHFYVHYFLLLWKLSKCSFYVCFKFHLLSSI